MINYFLKLPPVPHLTGAVALTSGRYNPIVLDAVSVAHKAVALLALTHVYVCAYARELPTEMRVGALQPHEVKFIFIAEHALLRLFLLVFAAGVVEKAAVLLLLILVDWRVANFSIHIHCSKLADVHGLRRIKSRRKSSSSVCNGNHVPKKALCKMTAAIVRVINIRVAHAVVFNSMIFYPRLLLLPFIYQVPITIRIICEELMPITVRANLY